MVRLRRILSTKGITAKACADFLGVSEKTLYNKFVGNTEFTYGEICKLKSLMPEYNIDYLLGEDDALQQV